MNYEYLRYMRAQIEWYDGIADHKDTEGALEEYEAALEMYETELEHHPGG